MEVKLEDFEKYRPLLFQRAKNYTKFSSVDKNWQYDIDLAKDVVQESYFKFHSMVLNNFQFENSEHLKALLLKNLWRVSSTSKMTNKGVKFRSKEDKLDLTILDSIYHPFECPEILSYYEIQNFYNVIHSIKYKNDLDVFLLSIEGYSNEEIQKKLNKTEGMVKQSIYRSRKHISKMLNLKKYLKNESTSN